MDIYEHINYWIKSAEHDLEVAETLFYNEKYDWCLYLCHLVIEKILKALWVKNNENKLPPKSHNLVRLAEYSKVKLTDEQKIFLDEINDFNIAVRYPDYKFEKHKGYGTALHVSLIKKHGYCKIHRKSFKIKALEATLFDNWL